MNSVKRYGGVINDYLTVHDWFDSTKSAFADPRYWAILYNAFGCIISETCSLKTEGSYDPRKRLSGIPVEEWMRGKGMKKRVEAMEMQYD